MRKVPNAIVVVDPKVEHNAVAEARILNIPVFAVMDTNCDPSVADYVIPANDDGVKAIKLIVGILADAVVEVYREWIDYVIKHADGIKKKKLLKTHEMIYDSLIKKDIETLNAAIDEHYDIIEELLG